MQERNLVKQLLSTLLQESFLSFLSLVRQHEEEDGVADLDQGLVEKALGLIFADWLAVDHDGVLREVLCGEKVRLLI